MVTKQRHKSKVENSESLPGILWDVSSKLRGISELFKNQGAEALLSQYGTYGVGALLGDLASDLEQAQETLETRK